MRRCIPVVIFGLLSHYLTYGFSTSSHVSAPFQQRRRFGVDLSRMRGGKSTPSHSNSNNNSFGIISRGGAKATSLSAESGGDGGDGSSKCPMRMASSVWGVSGVVYILAKAIRRLVPIALEPFKAGAVPLSTFQLSAYIGTVLMFAYAEGYKGFQCKFSPLVVSRSFTIFNGSGTPIHHVLLAPAYSMGLFHATKKRTIVSWSVTIGVAAIVATVKRLSYPWRNVLNAGAAVGLTWGAISILVHYVQALRTGTMPADPALPIIKKAKE